MIRPVACVVLLIAVCVAALLGARCAYQRTYADARGNSLPYHNETWEDPLAGPEQFVVEYPTQTEKPVPIAELLKQERERQKEKVH